jgi:hypothetical protein
MAEKNGNSKKVSIIVLLAAILVVGAIAAGASFLYSQQTSEGLIQEKQQTISSLEGEVNTAHNEIDRLEQLLESKETAVAPPPVEIPSGVDAGPQELDCLACHNLQQHKDFHVPEEIIKIDEAHGIRRRVCVDCHGPNGPPWSADEQMTDLSLIDFDPNVGVNGQFILSNRVVHSIHKRKLDEGSLSCDFCHVVGDSLDFTIPEVKSELGRVLYCQNEGCHDDEGGNYISIHVELRPFKCTTCHTGDLVNLHRGGTGVLGMFEVVNNTSQHILH